MTLSPPPPFKVVPGRFSPPTLATRRNRKTLHIGALCSSRLSRFLGGFQRVATDLFRACPSNVFWVSRMNRRNLCRAMRRCFFFKHLFSQTARPHQDLVPFSSMSFYIRPAQEAAPLLSGPFQRFRTGSPPPTMALWKFHSDLRPFRCMFKKCPPYLALSFRGFFRGLCIVVSRPRLSERASQGPNVFFRLFFQLIFSMEKKLFFLSLRARRRCNSRCPIRRTWGMPFSLNAFPFAVTTPRTIFSLFFPRLERFLFCPGKSLFVPPFVWAAVPSNAEES